MLKNASTLSALLVLVLLLGACKTREANGGKQGKWLNYAELDAAEEQQLRRQLKVEKRVALSSTVTDTGEVWYTSEVILYNTYGQPNLTQYFDLQGAVTKEIRYEYKDSLMTREVTTEATGYSSDMHYSYNPQGFKVQELFFQRGDTSLKRDYKIDAVGNELEVSLYRYREKVSLKLITERDAEGKPKHVREVQGDKTNWSETYEISDTAWHIRRIGEGNKLDGDFTMRFDANGALVQMINRGADGKTRMAADYTNDAKGRHTMEQFFGSTGLAMQVTDYKYGDNGLIAERILNSAGVGGRAITRYTYSYRK